VKKNILRVALISCLLLTSLFWGGAVFAQDDDLPDPGITPDSPFYFLDKLGKNIGMFFTFGAEAKAKKALRYAEERLSEARAMAEKNKIREMTRAANDYEGFMAMVNERLEAAVQNGMSANVSERLSALAFRIHTRLCELKDRLPPASSDNISPADRENSKKARETIERAKTVTIDGQVKALRLLARNKTEKALDISSETINKLMERARERIRVSDNASDNASVDVNEDLDYAARIAALEQEMVQIAEEKGLDITAIQQRLAQATSNRLEVLTRAYENAPEAARLGIENAIENSVGTYERVVEQLREKNALGEITANATALQNIPEKIRERLNLQISNAVQATGETIDSVKAQIRTEAENQEQNREQLSNNETGVSGNQTREQKELQTQTQERAGG
jgi:hypothetical protein